MLLGDMAIGCHEIEDAEIEDRDIGQPAIGPLDGANIKC